MTIKELEAFIDLLHSSRAKEINLDNEIAHARTVLRSVSADVPRFRKKIMEALKTDSGMAELLHKIEEERLSVL